MLLKPFEQSVPNAGKVNALPANLLENQNHAQKGNQETNTIKTLMHGQSSGLALKQKYHTGIRTNSAIIVLLKSAASMD
jgi:hypothetical protein